MQVNTRRFSDLIALNVPFSLSDPGHFTFANGDTYDAPTYLSRYIKKGHWEYTYTSVTTQYGVYSVVSGKKWVEETYQYTDIEFALLCLNCDMAGSAFVNMYGLGAKDATASISTLVQQVQSVMNQILVADAEYARLVHSEFQSMSGMYQADKDSMNAAINKMASVEERLKLTARELQERVEQLNTHVSEIGNSLDIVPESVRSINKQLDLTNKHVCAKVDTVQDQLSSLIALNGVNAAVGANAAAQSVIGNLIA